MVGKWNDHVYMNLSTVIYIYVYICVYNVYISTSVNLSVSIHIHYIYSPLQSAVLILMYKDIHALFIYICIYIHICRY